MRRAAALLACTASLLPLALAAFAGGGPEQAAAGALELRLEVAETGAGPAARVGAGEPVELVLEVRNTGGTPLALEFGSARTHDFAVLAPDGREVWRWSHGRFFAQALAQIALAPGESRRFAASWDQRDASGAHVPPGRYRVLGTLACVPATPPAAPVSLEIE